MYISYDYHVQTERSGLNSSQDGDLNLIYFSISFVHSMYIVHGKREDFRI